VPRSELDARRRLPGGLEHSEEDRAIPKHVGLLLTQSAVAMGLGLALRQAELDAACSSSRKALDVALSHREADARWAKGERLFGQAVRSEPSKPLPPHSKNQRKAARRARGAFELSPAQAASSAGFSLDRARCLPLPTGSLAVARLGSLRCARAALTRTR